MTHNLDLLEKRVQKAKVHLLLRQAFFGSLSLNMDFVFDESIMSNGTPTAATDGKRVLFHPAFVEKLDDQELLFVVAHEVSHPMFKHLTRRGVRDPALWNYAADIVINQLLTEDRIGKMPQGGLYQPDIYAKGEGITDKIYNILQEAGKEAGAPGGCDGNSSMDQLMDAQNQAEAQELEHQWSRNVARAGMAAKAAGQLSAGVKRLVDELLDSKVPWQDVLRRFVTKAKDDRRTFARPNRRFVTQGLVLPTLDGETMGEMVVAIDCSGSIGPKEISEFAAEVRAIQEDVRPRKIHVVYFDSRVCHYDVFDRDTPTVITPHGGGGTAFSPIFRYVAEKDIDPVCCVVLTDLYCGDFGPAPEYPVLWVTNGAEKAPWGEVTKM